MRYGECGIDTSPGSEYLDVMLTSGLTFTAWQIMSGSRKYPHCDSSEKTAKVEKEVARQFQGTGAACRIRTDDLPLTRRLLYQLS
jgi:hypothetical protein